MTEAANQGSVSAKANLGIFYSCVLTVIDDRPKDQSLCNGRESIKWFRAAVKDGMSDCYEMLIREIAYLVEYDSKLSSEERDGLSKESLRCVEKLGKLIR